jgi:hypothetical protein
MAARVSLLAIADCVSARADPWSECRNHAEATVRGRLRPLSQPRGSSSDADLVLRSVGLYPRRAGTDDLHDLLGGRDPNIQVAVEILERDERLKAKLSL